MQHAAKPISDFENQSRGKHISHLHFLSNSSVRRWEECWIRRYGNPYFADWLLAQTVKSVCLVFMFGRQPLGEAMNKISQAACRVTMTRKETCGSRWALSLAWHLSPPSDLSLFHHWSGCTTLCVHWSIANDEIVGYELRCVY